MPGHLRLTSPPAVRERPSLDSVQRQAAEHPVGAGHLLVVGAPGTGKTTTALAAFERRLGLGEQALFLSSTRRAAARARDEISARLDRTLGHVLVRTPASFAFSVLRARASLLGEPAPTLVTGPDQDAVLAELLAGHQAGAGAAPAWPDRVRAALGLPAFRGELRDLLMRAAEAGLDAEGLADLGDRHGRGEWAAAAVVLREYEQVLRLGQLTPDRGERLDAASIVDRAIAALRSWPSGAQAPRFDTVVVDDLQDATLATARLLRALVEDGAELILFGDADAGVHGFRGGAPSLVGAAEAGSGEVGGFGATRLVLATAWRQTPELRAVTASITAHLPVAGGARHRNAVAGRPEPAGAPAGIEVAVLRTRAQEAAYVARMIREERLRNGTPYGAIAVVVRGGEHAARLQRMLAEAGVPVTASGGARALRDSAVVRALLSAMDVATGIAELTPEVAVALLGSPLAGGHRVDAVSLRALRRALLAEAAIGGDSRPGEDLLVEALADPARCATLPPRVRWGPQHLADVLASGRRAAAEPRATAETVLWALWSTTGLASTWRREALAGGPGGERADRDLDVVLELFRAAEQFTDRHPAAHPGEFIRNVRSQAMAADSLAPRGSVEDLVRVVTPAGAAGKEWEVVAVAGVQEDVWPDLRIRDTLLGAHELAELAAGRAVPGPEDVWRARREVLQDELRAFAVAVSRARRRLLVTAVRDADLSPSTFLDLVEPARDPSGMRQLAPLVEPLDLRGLVARLRAELPDGPDAAAAASILARLGARGVPGAAPGSWSAAFEVTTTEPLWGESDLVPVSPSTVDTALACPLRWALERAGGRPDTAGARSIGSLFHAIAADLPHGTESELRAELDRRWPELGLGDGWSARHQRRLAEAIVRRLAGYVASRPGRVETEVPIEATVGRALVTGRIDRVEHGPDGTVRVVDLKTGRAGTTDVSDNPQLGAYQAAVDHGGLGRGVASGGASLVYLGSGVRAPERHQPALDGDVWASDMLAEVVRSACAATFEATIGDGCRTCPVRSSCPARPDGERVSQ